MHLDENVIRTGTEKYVKGNETGIEKYVEYVNM